MGKKITDYALQPILNTFAYDYLYRNMYMTKY